MRRAAAAALLALAGSGLLGVALFASPAGVAAADPARTHEVVIQGLLYVPETLTVRPGDVVVWVNKDPFPHTVTAAGAFDSGSIATGKSWRFTAKKAGTYPYKDDDIFLITQGQGARLIQLDPSLRDHTASPRRSTHPAEAGVRVRTRPPGRSGRRCGATCQ